jgi:hypothetical protein
MFNVKKSAISKHVKNIFDAGELDRKATVSKMETVAFLTSSPVSYQRYGHPACRSA